MDISPLNHLRKPVLLAKERFIIVQAWCEGLTGAMALIRVEGWR
jgi:hypothetical protein